MGLLNLYHCYNKAFLSFSASAYGIGIAENEGRAAVAQPWTPDTRHWVIRGFGVGGSLVQWCSVLGQHLGKGWNQLLSIVVVPHSVFSILFSGHYWLLVVAIPLTNHSQPQKTKYTRSLSGCILPQKKSIYLYVIPKFKIRRNRRINVLPICTADPFYMGVCLPMH